MSDSRATPQPGDDAMGRGSGPITILLAEDNKVIADMLKEILESHGYRVRHAMRVAEAMEIAAREPIDVLLSDLRLPDGKGWDLMARLRETRPMLGIMMSGYSDDIYRRKAREAGFDEYLVKPVDDEVLCERIAQLVGRSRDGIGQA